MVEKKNFWTSKKKFGEPSLSLLKQLFSLGHGEKKPALNVGLSTEHAVDKSSSKEEHRFSLTPSNIWPCRQFMCVYVSFWEIQLCHTTWGWSRLTCKDTLLLMLMSFFNVWRPLMKFHSTSTFHLHCVWVPAKISQTGMAKLWHIKMKLTAQQDTTRVFWWVNWSFQFSLGSCLVTFVAKGLAVTTGEVETFSWSSTCLQLTFINPLWILYSLPARPTPLWMPFGSNYETQYLRRKYNLKLMFVSLRQPDIDVK